MAQVASIIGSIYHAYAGKLGEINVRLDVDVPDPSVKLAKASAAEKIFAGYLDFVLKNPLPGRKRATITLAVSRGKLILRDEARLLLPEQRAIFEALATTAHAELTLRTRVGFGTTLSLPLGA